MKNADPFACLQGGHPTTGSQPRNKQSYAGFLNLDIQADKTRKKTASC